MTSLTRALVPLLTIITAAHAFANDTGWTGNGGNNFWNNAGNWDNGVPAINAGSQMFFKGTNRLTSTNDLAAFSEFQSIVFEITAGAFTLNGNTLKLYNKLQNDSASTQTISFNGLIFTGGNASTTVNQINPNSGDLIINSPIFLDNNSTINVNPTSSHIARFNGVIANGTGSTGAFSINNDATVIFNAANTYSGDTLINAGELRFTSNGSVANSTIRLGGTAANSGSAYLVLGAFQGDTAAVSIGSTLVVRASGSGTQGERVLFSNNTSGTNTYSGGIFLDAALSLRSSTGGTLLLQGGSVDVKNRVLTVDDRQVGGTVSNVNVQGTVTINEVLGSSFAAGGSLVKNGTNTLILQGTSNNYTGTDSTQLNANGTQIGGGTLGIYGDGSLGLAPAGAYNNIQFTGSGTLQDTANNISLDAKRNISVASGATATFDSNGNTFKINGVINNPSGTGNIAKTGAGTLTLTAANTYAGTTAVNQGTLALDNNNTTTARLAGTSGITVNPGGTLLLVQTGAASNDRINNAATFTFNGGTFNTGGLQEHGASNNTAGIGAVTLQSSSIIDMGSSNSILAFANSSANSIAWGTGRTLDIWNWTGTPITGGGTDQLYFGSDATGLTATQLQEIRFFSGPGSGLYGGPTGILANGEVVPVPEPSTWAAGILSVAALGFTQRRRFAGLLKIA